ncbi:uncharacterized protein [Procambarus clarkii]|uniref:uncharacterized protein n=1 Tax=Procambarus clarkii TaxID=6728 RepID=UPI001E6764DD|nr:uncharacterized protein LOC123773878 [Procambarus clarkii]XP_045623760.1 uncharacterized protein LOC123773878 [Procambarus clarkii]XP_045623761.1 uncharacterized protein LOC123773878 [Procambarus clarkii]
MTCHMDATSVKALLLTLVALAACVTPTASQIHWNRGWGAGGSMGKRSPPATGAVAASPLAEAPEVDADVVLSPDCSLDMNYVSGLLAKIIESEVTRVVSCMERGGSSVVVGSEQDQLTRYPWWMAVRGKVPTTDQ